MARARASSRAPARAGHGAASRTYTIAELAREFGVTHRTIRFYEDNGLIAPLRDGRRRVFRQRDRTRLRLALRGRRLGFALAEVRQIIDLYDAPAGEGRQLALLLDKIAARRAELEAKRRDIEAAIADLGRVARECRKRRRDLAKAGAGAGADTPRRAKARGERPGDLT